MNKCNMTGQEVSIEHVAPNIAEDLCRRITADLPEYFGLPGVNEHYATGVRSRTNFAAKIANQYVGLISIDFPYSTNANIYWLAVLRDFHGKGVGTALISSAVKHPKLREAKTITVETLAPFEADENYLETYKFYEAQGFSPLFNLKPRDYEWNMVYMCKMLSPIHLEDKTQKIAPSFIKTTNIALASKIEPGTEKELEDFGNRLYDFCKQIVPEFVGKTYEQCHEYLRYVIKNNGKDIAGILGKVKLNNTLYIEDLFVDASFRNQGYASALLTHIESEAKSRGCYLAYLETINQEALAFYTNLGYQIFAQLNDEPCRNVTNFYLKKNL